MDKRLGIKTYEDIMEEIHTKVLRDPIQIQKMITYLDQQIKEIDEELRAVELEAKYGHTIKKTMEFDFYKNSIQYTERTPEGEVIVQHTRGFKPRDDFKITNRKV